MTLGSKVAISLLVAGLAWFFAAGIITLRGPAPIDPALSGALVFLAALAILSFPDIRRFRARDRQRWATIVSAVLLSGLAVTAATVAFVAYRASEILDNHSGGIPDVCYPDVRSCQPAQPPRP